MIVPSKTFIELFKNKDGALSVSESIAIANIAALAPEGTYIELGTHKGKSAMSALVGLKRGCFYLVDPIFEDQELSNKVKEWIEESLLEPEKVSIKLMAGYSTDIIPQQENYSYVFVDSGSHGDGLPMSEVKLLEDRVVANGIISFHDFRSQFVEVEQAYNYLLGTGKYEEVPINWDEIVNYVRVNDLEKGNKSWHHTEMDFPCFVGALKRK